jgi:hypothetical protein
MTPKNDEPADKPESHSREIARFRGIAEALQQARFRKQARLHEKRRRSVVLALGVLVTVLGALLSFPLRSELGAPPLRTVVRSNDRVDGYIEWQVPTRLKVGEPDTSQALVAFAKEFVRKRIKGATGSAKLRVGSDMAVRLRSLDGAVEVKPDWEEVQPVEPTSETKWAWHVTAKESGVHDLSLIASVLLADHKAPEKHLETFRTTIRVEANAWYDIRQYIGQHGEDIWKYLVIVPILATVAWIKKQLSRMIERRRQRAAEKNSPSGPYDF